MTPQWVELIAAHPKHGEKGKKLELNEATAKSLIDDGFAKAIDKPEGPSPEALELANQIESKIASGLETLRTGTRWRPRTRRCTWFRGPRPGGLGHLNQRRGLGERVRVG